MMQSIDLEKKINDVEQQKENLIKQMESLQEQFKEALVKEALNEINDAGKLREQISGLKEKLEEIEQLLPALYQKLKMQKKAEEEEARAKSKAEADKVKSDIKNNHIPAVEKGMQDLLASLQKLRTEQRRFTHLMSQAKGSIHHTAPSLGFQIETGLIDLLQEYKNEKVRRKSQADRRSREADLLINEGQDQEAVYDNLQDLSEEELAQLMKSE